MAKRDLTIGLDIGGTKILAVLVDGKGGKIKECRAKTPLEGDEGLFLKCLITLINRLLENRNTDQVQGIGIATAGIINSQTNEILYANNLNLKNVQIGKVLNERFQLPVKISNDANAAALAEKRWGGHSDIDNLIYITVSTGIGSGIISSGVVITGVSHSAGEFGHVSINQDGPECPCGNKGCLENYASGTAIAMLAQERLKNGETSLFFKKYLDYEKITAEDVCKGATQQDCFCVSVLNETGYYLGVGITNLIHLFSPGVVSLGGGVIKSAASQLLPVIQKTVEERGISSMVKQVKITSSSLGDDICAKGAACLFSEKEKAD